MVAEPVLGAVPTEGLLAAPGWPGLAVEVGFMAEQHRKMAELGSAQRK